ncbi:XRE family transcriptional regulator [Kribbella sp. ALI-6-A]|uniref:NBR1-Ig-like domain-containing protein n=1 Tax=Kribbella sp. ALI-6-A TaxID=1933817 RepID=UPI00097BC48D|nr:NBR1-Ig-like domain-containing protein [Kribbella sp. ALI-6-A]ONI72205.1 XRE family transcriptional regulator [Kribbella sp. ALI-6-A]
MRPAQVRSLIGSRMRELREAAGIPLTRAASLSGWDKGHLSRVERGHTRPSRELIEWYDESFGAGRALVNQLVELDAAVRAGKDVSQRDLRRQVQPMLLGGSVPVDHHPDDRAELVGESVPDGTRIARDQQFEKTWELRNSGERPWHDRWLTRQGAAATPGWMRSPRSARIPDAVPGQVVTVRMTLQAPSQVGASTAYFKVTDDAGRLYYPGLESPPIYCTIFTVHEL